MGMPGTVSKRSFNIQPNWREHKKLKILRYIATLWGVFGGMGSENPLVHRYIIGENGR